MRALLKLLDQVGPSDVPRVQAAIAQRRRELEEQAALAERGSSSWHGARGETATQQRETPRRKDFEALIDLVDLGGSSSGG